MQYFRLFQKCTFFNVVSFLFCQFHFFNQVCCVCLFVVFVCLLIVVFHYSTFCLQGQGNQSVLKNKMMDTPLFVTSLALEPESQKILHTFHSLRSRILSRNAFPGFRALCGIGDGFRFMYKASCLSYSNFRSMQASACKKVHIYYFYVERKKQRVFLFSAFATVFMDSAVHLCSD